MAEKKKTKEKEKEINYKFNAEQAKDYLEDIQDQIINHPVVKNHHGKWKELIAWTDRGEQYSQWKGGKLAPADLHLRKTQVVVNFMKPVSEAIEGKMQLIYKLAGQPNSGEQEDIQASTVATKLLAHNDYVNDVEGKMEDFKYDLIRTGNACLKWMWDESKFGYIPLHEKEKTEKVKQDGEVTMFVPSIFNIRPSTIGKDRNTWPNFIELMEVATQDIIDEPEFKITKEEIEPSGQSKDGKYSGMNEKEEDKADDQKTKIVAFDWHRKSKKYPEGRLIISIKDKILFSKANPCLGEIPYFLTIFKRDGNSIWGTGPMHHIQDLNRRLNRMVSITCEHIESWRPKVIMESDALLKRESFTTDAAEILEAMPGKIGDVKALAMPQLSSEVAAMIQFFLSSKDMVSNIHEVSYSQLPKYASRAPASLFAMMLEQENLKIDPLIKRLNSMIRESGSFRLRLMDKYYKQDRMVLVMGEGQQASIDYFKGADLDDNFDVKLEIGVSIHQSQAVLGDMLIQLKREGILSESDNNKIIKLLNIGDASEELRGDVADVTRAMRENQAFISNKDDAEFGEGGVKLYKHDDHALHLDYHTNLRKQDSTEQWEQERLDRLDVHIDEHWTKVMEERQLASALQALGGGGAGPGEGTPPNQPTIEGTPGPEAGAEF